MLHREKGNEREKQKERQGQKERKRQKEKGKRQKEIRIEREKDRGREKKTEGERKRQREREKDRERERKPLKARENASLTLTLALSSSHPGWWDCTSRCWAQLEVTWRSDLDIIISMKCFQNTSSRLKSFHKDIWRCGYAPSYDNCFIKLLYSSVCCVSWMCCLSALACNDVAEFFNSAVGLSENKKRTGVE